MLILAIDTATPQVGVAIGGHEGVIASAHTVAIGWDARTSASTAFTSSGSRSAFGSAAGSESMAAVISCSIG